MDFDTDISNLNRDSFPQLSDWYDLLVQLSETDSKYSDLAILMKSMAIGADAFLWNGRTNIDSNNQIVCFDTNKLLNFSQATQASCYFNILSLCWDIISRNRDERIILFMDEGHIALDPRLPEVGLYLRNLAKRIRKYEGGLWFVSQSSADMLHESIRMSGQAIVDNAAYRLLFRCEAKNLEDTVDLFRLTPAESKLLAVLERKNALLKHSTEEEKALERMHEEMETLTVRYRTLRKNMLESSPVYKKLHQLAKQKKPQNTRTLISEELWE